jgi:hypothetical protein
MFTGLAVTVPCARSTSPAPAGKNEQSPRKKTAADKKQTASSLTGCVDQQESHYILIDDHGLTKIADLEADGFPSEGFAKHLGHKVIVRGITVTNNTVPLFKVRKVETISETCAPQSTQQGKQ